MEQSNKNHVIKNVLLALFIFSFISGCVSSSDPALITEDNVYESKNMPKLKLDIDQRIEYIGTSSNNKNHQATDRTTYIIPESSDSMIFCEYDENNKIKKGLIIRKSSLLKGRVKHFLLHDFCLIVP